MPLFLPRPQRDILRAMIEGGALRFQTFLNGSKAHLLKPLDGDPIPVRARTVEALLRKRLIEGNQKFPVTTYLLTQEGQSVAEALSKKPRNPLAMRASGKGKPPRG